MGGFIEKLLPLGQDGLYRPSRAGHAVDTVPPGACKTLNNFCYNGQTDVQVRGGFIEAFYNPTDGSMVYHRNTFGAPDEFYQRIIDWNDGMRGLFRFEHVRNDGKILSDDQYLHHRYTIGAGRDQAIAPDPLNQIYPETHAFTWRNPAIPSINMLEAPVLDRSVWPNAFNDVNIRGMERSRFWDFVTYPWLGGGKTFLLGTYGGHWRAPQGTPEPPDPWNTLAPGYPGPGSNWTFDRPRLNSTCVQRRVLVWDPYWFEDWKRISPAIGSGAYDVGPYNWGWPFVWYWETANPDRYYFEPCGAFLSEYSGSLFMFRTERTIMSPSGPTWRYDPDRITWSRQGYPSALIMGTPSEWPHYVPFEYKRTWRDERDGSGNPQSAYFRPARDGHIVGAPKWGGKQWVVKPGGFGRIDGEYHGNFTLFDYEATREGPAGRFAYCVTPNGIVYANPTGVKIFDGNPVGKYKNMADYRNMNALFRNEIAWETTAQNATSETFAISMEYDPVNQQVIGSYAKVGTTGAVTGNPGDAAYLPPGTPTRQFVIDMTQERFCEWNLKTTREDMTNTVGPGIMLAGREPVIEDNTILGTAPIGGHGGRIFWVLNKGHLDGVELNSNGEPRLDTGRTINWDFETKDYRFNSLVPIVAIENHRCVIYVDDDRYDGSTLIAEIKRKITYDYGEAHTSDDTAPAEPEPKLEYRSLEDYMQQKIIVNKVKKTGRNLGYMSAVSFGFYNDLTDRDDPDNKAPIGPVIFIQHSIMVQSTDGIGSKE